MFPFPLGHPPSGAGPESVRTSEVSLEGSAPRRRSTSEEERRKMKVGMAVSEDREIGEEERVSLSG